MTALQDHQQSSAFTTPQIRVGRFSYDFETEVWDWDDEVFRIHGYRSWSITPTTDHMLACQHAGDRERVCDVLARARSSQEPLSVSYRLAAADSVLRKVLLVCEGERHGDDDPVSVINGYYIDLTEDFRAESAEVAHQVTASAQHRFAIERAVGGLMLAYGLTADQAFGTLRWWSQNQNVKIRHLAGSLVDAVSRGAASTPEIRRTFDALLHDASTQSPPQRATSSSAWHHPAPPQP